MLCRSAGLRHLRNGRCLVNVKRYHNFVINWVNFGTPIGIFVKIGRWKPLFTARWKLNFDRIFYPTGINSVREMYTNIYWVTESFVKIGGVKVTLHLWACYPHCCPILMKIGVTDLHITLLTMCKFRENRRREGRTSVKGIKHINL